MMVCLTSTPGPPLVIASFINIIKLVWVIKIEKAKLRACIYECEFSLYKNTFLSLLLLFMTTRSNYRLLDVFFFTSWQLRPLNATQWAFKIGQISRNATLRLFDSIVWKPLCVVSTSRPAATEVINTCRFFTPPPAPNVASEPPPPTPLSSKSRQQRFLMPRRSLITASCAIHGDSEPLLWNMTHFLPQLPSANCFGTVRKSIQGKYCY